MQTIGKIFRVLWAGLDGLRKVLHLLFLLVVVIVLIAVLSPRLPAVPAQAVLLIAPEGDLVEQLTGDPFQRAVSEAYGSRRPETLLRHTIDAIDAAKSDARIKGLVLDLSNMTGGGMAKLEEVAAAVRDFKRSGKPVIALGESYDQSQYYLAANADEIYLDPDGLVLLDGFGYYRTYLKDALDKLSVDVNIFKAGKFKSYTDEYSRNDMSDQEREETGAWLGALWSQYQKAVTSSRNLPPEGIKTYVDQFVSSVREHKGDTAAVALENNLVTELRPRLSVEARIKSLSGEDEETHSFRSIGPVDYLRAIRAQESVGHISQPHIGVVVASGEILDGEQPPGTIGDESMITLLRQARYDESIKAIVLRIDSPGGSMQASEMIRREIDELKHAGKPVVASMSSTAASGGYYIAMDADEIWAAPTTLTGSIGVFAVFPTLQRTLEKFGVHVDGIGTTPLSGALRLDRTLGEQPKQFLQLSVEHAYQSFVGHVADARSKSFEDIDAIAQGRVWAASDAASIGLVDHLGSFHQALEAAAKRAKLGKDYKVQYIEASLGWREAFAREVNTQSARLVKAILPRQASFGSSMQQVLSPLETEVARLERLAKQRAPAYYCACTVK
jgi:protease-4